MTGKSELTGEQLMAPVTLYDLKQFEDRITARQNRMLDRIDHVDDELATHIQKILLYLVLTMFGGAVVVWAGSVIVKAALGIF